ncbi:hypothetical protein YC2023_012560 [Brassica napus]
MGIISLLFRVICLLCSLSCVDSLMMNMGYAWVYKNEDAYLNLSLSLLGAEMGSTDNTISYGSASVLSLLLILPLLYGAEGCDMFTGRWVEDASYPIYDPSTCPFIRREFACKRNGRPDLDYPTFRWQPQGCKLAMYDIEFFSRSVRQTTYLGSRLAVDNLPGSRLVNADKLPNEEKSDIRTYQNAQIYYERETSSEDFHEVQTTSWKSRRLPGSPDDFLEVQTTLSEDFQEAQTTSRRLPDD